MNFSSPVAMNVPDIFAQLLVSEIIRPVGLFICAGKYKAMVPLLFGRVSEKKMLKASIAHKGNVDELVKLKSLTQNSQ